MPDNMPLLDWQPLIDRFLEDPEQLSEQELSALVAAVADTPDLAERLREQLVVDELLSQRLAAERQNFPAQVEQRVGDLAQGEEELLEQINAMRDLAVEQLRKPGGANGSAWRVWGITAVLFIGVGIAAYFLRPIPSPIATVVELEGGATLLRGGIETPLLAGTGLRDGDRLFTKPESRALVRYPDGTWVRLFDETLARLARDTAGGGKRVFIDHGKLASGITPQPAGHPMLFISPTATAKVVGTEIWLSVDKQSTELSVTDGKVEFYRANAPQVAVVSPGEIGVASLTGLEVKESLWPAERRSLLFAFSTAGEPALLRGDRKGTLHGTRLVTRGDAAYNLRGGMAMRGGAFMPEEEDVDEEVLAGCQETNEITVEAVLRSERLDQEGPAQLISYTDEESSSDTFSLGQQGDSLIWRFKTDTQGDREFPLCKLVLRKTTHCVVSYRSGHLTCYIDGVKVFDDTVVTSGFANWKKRNLAFGAEATGERAWQGTLEGVAVYNRYFAEEDAQRSAEHYQSEYLSAAVDPNWKELFPLVDLNRDVVAGTWTYDGESLRSTATSAGRLMLPLAPDGNYQLQVEFTRLSGTEPLSLVFPVGQTQARLVFDGPALQDASRTTLELVEGQAKHESVISLADPTLEDGRRYRAQISVTTAGAKSHVAVSLDEHSVLEWSGPTRLLSVSSPFELPDRRRPALVSETGELRFHAARLKMTTGQAVE